MVDTNSSILFPEQIRRKHPPDDDTHTNTHSQKDTHKISIPLLLSIEAQSIFLGKFLLFAQVNKTIT